MKTLQQAEYPKGQKEKKILKRTKPQEATSTEKKSSEDQPSVSIPVNSFKLIDYKKILEANIFAAAEYSAPNGNNQEKFTIRNIRQMIHLDVLNVLVVNALASGQQEWILNMLEDYYAKFIDTHYDHGVVARYLLPDTLLDSMYHELRIDNFIANIPFYDVHCKILVGSCYFDIDSLKNALSILLPTWRWDDTVDKFELIMKGLFTEYNIPNRMLETFNISNYHINVVTHEEVNIEDDEHDVV